MIEEGRGCLRGRWTLLPWMVVSMLAHAVCFWCSPPLQVPRPASAPVEIGWRQLPRQETPVAAAPPVTKPVTEKPVASTVAAPHQVPPVTAPKWPAPQPLPPASPKAAIAPAVSAPEPRAEVPHSGGGETNLASSSTPVASAPVATTLPPGANTALVEAVPLAGNNPPPNYPRLARQRGWEGLVSLKVRVSAQGEVEEVWVEQSSGHGVLDQAALKAVKEWRFQPAREGERAVSGLARVPIEFRLRGG